MTDFEQDKRMVQNCLWALVPLRLRKPLIVVGMVVALVITVVGPVASLAGMGPSESIEEPTIEESSQSSEGAGISMNKFVSVEVCNETGEAWGNLVNIESGELAKCRITFTNDNEYPVNDVELTCVVSSNLEVSGDVVTNRIDGEVQAGIRYSSGIYTIPIGDYLPGETSETILFLRAVDAERTGGESLTASASVNGNPYQQTARVMVENSNGGWGDNIGGRHSFTHAEVAAGVLGDAVVFNSLSDGIIGHEFNFVGARKMGADELWSADSIEVEDGEAYTIRLYVHNDNPLGYKSLAKDVRIMFSLPMRFSKALTVVGYLDSPNAVPSRYWDCVTFKSAHYFYIEYVSGSARLLNASIGSSVPLADDIIFKDGVQIGFDALDGLVPGGDEYRDCVVTIDVLVHAKS